MKYITTLIVALCATFSLSAQSLEVKRNPSAERVIQRVEATPQAQTVMGYRIGIFFDNGQDARTKATEAKELFEASFPTQPVYMVYESPYYKVSGGNCLTDEEAIMLFERIRKVFPNAYVMRESMELSSFIKLPVVPADTLGLTLEVVSPEE